MAVHNYSRQTEDLDLAVSEPFERFQKLADDLRRRGFQVEMAEPDAQDPLGGVLTIPARTRVQCRSSISTIRRSLQDTHASGGSR
jgi:hypothetical protein